MLKKFLQRLAGQSGGKRARKRVRRGLRIERLDKRVVLASDLGAIAGVVYVDLDGDGLDATDTRLAGVDVRLFRDGGDGVFGGDDVLVGTVTSGALASATPGGYRFDGLSAGLYFLEQDDADVPAGLINPNPVAVTVVNESGVRVEAIDEYDQTAVTLTANSATPNVPNSSLAPEAIGGARDVLLIHDTGAGQLNLLVTPGTAELFIGSIGGSTGSALIQYDGPDGSTTLSATGLGGVNLSGGDSRAGINVLVDPDANAGTFELTVYTSATAFSTAIGTYAAGPFAQPLDIFIPFSSFVQGGTATAPANFTNVGAIELTADIVDNQDIQLSVFESLRPDVVAANLENIQPLTIGNLVFQDNNNDGIFNGTDVGIAGVDVELYSVATGTSVVNPATDTLVATTTTDSNGAYSFANVEPGFYAIVIPAREFDPSSVAAGARTLVGFATSTPTPETAGADANIDNDDDGRAVTGQLYVASGTFSLISGAEPTGGGNTNNTFDFGFVSNADLAVTKTFVSLDTATDGTRTATFRISVTNNGPVTATGISVEDTIPSGLTFAAITNQTPAGAVTSSAASTAGRVFELINLPSSASLSFDVQFTVNAGVFADQTNSVTVTGDQNDPVTTNNTATALLDLPQTDLSITKSLETTAGNVIPPATARTGDTVVYRITVNNDIANSPTIDDQATGVTVLDTLPAGVTFVSGTVNGGAVGNGIAFNSTLNQVTATVGTVNRGTPAVILLTVTLDSDAADLITNTAVVSNTPDTDANTSNDTASVDNSVQRAVDLAIVKAISDNPGDNTSPIFGAPISFEITVTNTTASPGVARGFTVTDTLPAGLTFVAGSFDAGTSGVTIVNSGQLLTFTGGALNIGQSVSFTFDALVAQNAPASITNTAVVAPISNGTITDVDINSANNTESEVIAPVRDIELVVAKSSNFSGTQTPTPGGVTTDTQSATPGGNITYTILVTNSGPSDAIDVNVTDTLPTGFTATSITIGGNQVTDNNPDAGTLAFVIPTVPAGTTGVSVLVTGSIVGTASGTLTNSVTIAGGGTGDLPAGNNASVVTPLTAVFDVGVTKNGPATAIPGSATDIVYTIAVTNPTGPSTATNVTVTDTLPAGVTFQSATLNGIAITPTIAGQVLTFTIPAITAGTPGNQSLVITARVTAPTLTGTIVNNVTVAATGDSNAANNTASFTTNLTPNVDVNVQKTVNSANATPGASLTYTITVNNTGPSAAAGVTLTDVLPTGLAFTSGTGPNGQVLTATGQTVNIPAIGTLAPNTPLVYTIIAAIGSTFTGSLVNTATVGTTSTDTNTANNTANVTTTVTDPDPNTGSITGRVFRDANNNGLFEPGDVGIPGVTLRLRNPGNATILQTTVTGADGTYAFTGLAAGTYEVEQVQPAGLRDGLEQAGTGATPAQTPNDTITPITVTRATASPGFNFAELELVSKRRFLASTGVVF
jgi:uncharacterized repeat protein (TIGR01451 family)